MDDGVLPKASQFAAEQAASPDDSIGGEALSPTHDYTQRLQNIVPEGFVVSKTSHYLDQRQPVQYDILCPEKSPPLRDAIRQKVAGWIHGETADRPPLYTQLAVALEEMYFAYHRQGNSVVLNISQNDAARLAKKLELQPHRLGKMTQILSDYREGCEISSSRYGRGHVESRHPEQAGRFGRGLHGFDS